MVKIHWINFYLILIVSLTGGKSESNANLAEGMATALVCFDDMANSRETDSVSKKYCILVCNSSPYLMPVMECHQYENKTADQLAVIFKEVNSYQLSQLSISL